MLVSALIRRVQNAGGFATVMARGDDAAGAILVECTHRGERQLIIERSTDLDGRDGWRVSDAAPAADPAASDARLARRRQQDRDLWIIELDIAEAERFAAETIGSA